MQTLKVMGRNKTLAKNVSYVMIGNIGAKLIGFILLPFYTRWLTPSDYGVTDIIGVYASLLASFGALNIAAAIFVFPSGANENAIKGYFSSGIALQIVCSIVLIPIFWIISLLPYESAFVQYAWFIYGSLISTLLQNYTQSFCRGIGKMKVFSYTGIVNSGLLFGLSFLFIPTFGVAGFVYSNIISNVLTSLFTFVYSKSYLYLSINDANKPCLKEMLRYCVPLMPTGLMWWLVNSLNRPLLEEYCGLFAIGLLAVGNKLPSIMNMVFGFFQQAWMVTVLDEYKKQDFADYYRKMFRMIFFVQMFVCLLITFCAKPFVHIMTTDEYYEAWKFIPLVTLGTLFSNVTAFSGALFTAHRNSKFIFTTSIAGGVTSLIANFLLIPFFGLYGACISIILAHLSSCVMRLKKTQVYMSFNEGGYILSQAVIALLAYGASFLSLWMSICGYILSVILLLGTNYQLFFDLFILIKTRVNEQRNVTS